VFEALADQLIEAGVFDEGDYEDFELPCSSSFATREELENSRSE